MKLRTLALVLAGGAILGSAVARANGGGASTAMAAYYDGRLFAINFSELPAGGERANHTHNGSINRIYQCDACEGQLPGGGDFVSVLDAIQGGGFNPIWEEQQITFNAGFAPRQLFSDDEIAGAAAAGEITITDTDELYICAVLGAKR